MVEEQDVVSSRYRLIESLGEGAMGRVWLARDEILHRDVAIKEIAQPPAMTDHDQSEAHRRTLQEARAAARLNHPNIIRIHDVLRSPGRSWIVMEYVRSRSLLQVLREDGRLAPAQAARIGLAVVAALDAAHRGGVVHRDVKPSNVLIAADGRVVLTDFGVASTVDTDDPGTQSRYVLGSPGYVAPERVMDVNSGPSADLWSLGATLYAAVEGRNPFNRSSLMDTLSALVNDPPDPMRHAGPLAPVVTGLLNKDPRLRMGADEAAAQLRRLADGDRGPLRRLVPRPPTGPPTGAG